MGNPYKTTSIIYPTSIKYITVPILEIKVPDEIANDRNWQLFIGNIVPDEESGCWNWGGHLDVDGYGKWTRTIKGEKSYYRAHRYSYERLVGPIPEGLVIDHLCRNRACVNPNHLEPVSTGENTRRGNTGKTAKERAAKIKHCPQGHPYKGWNLIMYQGRRFCRQCMYDRAAVYREKKRSNG